MRLPPLAASAAPSLAAFSPGSSGPRRAPPPGLVCHPAAGGRESRARRPRGMEFGARRDAGGPERARRGGVGSRWHRLGAAQRVRGAARQRGTAPVNVYTGGLPRC